MKARPIFLMKKREREILDEIVTLFSLSLGMRENGEGNIRWLSVDSKSFEISVEEGGNKLKGKITE